MNDAFDTYTKIFRISCYWNPTKKKCDNIFYVATKNRGDALDMLLYYFVVDGIAEPQGARYEVSLIPASQIPYGEVLIASDQLYGFGGQALEISATETNNHDRIWTDCYTKPNFVTCGKHEFLKRFYDWATFQIDFKNWDGSPIDPRIACRGLGDDNTITLFWKGIDFTYFTNEIPFSEIRIPTFVI